MSEIDARPTDSDAPLPLDPVVEAYKQHVDRSLIREQLRRTIDERIERMLAALRLAEALAAAGRGGRT